MALEADHDDLLDQYGGARSRARHGVACSAARSASPDALPGAARWLGAAVTTGAPTVTPSSDDRHRAVVEVIEQLVGDLTP